MRAFISFLQIILIKKNMNREIKLQVIKDLEKLKSNEWYDQDSLSGRFVNIIRLFRNFTTVEQRNNFITSLVTLISYKKIAGLKPDAVGKLMQRFIVYPEIFDDLNCFVKLAKGRDIKTIYIEKIIFYSGVNPCSRKEQFSRLLLLSQLHNDPKSGGSSKANTAFIHAILELKIPVSDQSRLKSQLKNDLASPYLLLFERIRKISHSELSGMDITEIINKHFSPIDHELLYSPVNQRMMERFDEILPEDFLLRLNRGDLKKISRVVNLRPSLIDDLPDMRHQEISGYTVFHTLFSKFKIPPVLIRKYFDNYMNESERTWFYHVLEGRNMTSAPNLPFKFTKRMAHTFQNMDDVHNLSVTQYLFFSALLTLTFDEHYAHTVTRASWASNQADFWINTMALLYQNGLRENNAREVYDYILHKVFRERCPLELKRKKISNLLRDVEEWHNELRIKQEERYTNKQKLADSGIPDSMIELGEKTYEIKQLKDSNELFHEGSDLRHCVHTYRYQCKSGKSFIFSLRQKLGEKNEKRLVTIEVVNNEIVQAKGQRNRQPNDLEKEIIQLWADEQMIRFTA
jgi:hypothetical protein